MSYVRFKRYFCFISMWYKSKTVFSATVNMNVLIDWEDISKLIHVFSNISIYILFIWMDFV